MRKTGKKGFTLTELIVVLVIMGIIAAIAVPLFTNYWRNAEFRKNEENARTVYLALKRRGLGEWLFYFADIVFIQQVSSLIDAHKSL